GVDQRGAVRRGVQPDGGGAHADLRRDARRELRPRRHDGLGHVPGVPARDARRGRSVRGVRPLRGRAVRARSPDPARARRPYRGRAPRDADSPDARRRAGARERRADGVRAGADARHVVAGDRDALARAGVRGREPARRVRGGGRADPRPVDVPVPDRAGPDHPGRGRQHLRRAGDRHRRAARLRGRVRHRRRLRGRRRRSGLLDPAVPAADRTLAVGDLVQRRDHRRHGQPGRRVRRRTAGVGRRVAGRRVPQAVAEGAVQLHAADRDPPVPAGGALRQARVMRWALLAALAVLLALPTVLSSYAVTLFILIFFYGFLGQAWNVVGGYAGQLSVGHAAFVGVGGYTAAMLSIELGLTPWLGMLVGAALSAVLGAVIGYLGFRFGLRGFYFVLLTEALGVNAFAYKMRAMVVSSFLTGLGGTFYAFYLFSLQPNTLFGIPLSVEIVIRPIIGGAGTLLGPILGSFILTPLAELSRLYLGQGGLHGAHLIAYGVLLIGVVLFLPEGAYPRLRRALTRRDQSGLAAHTSTHATSTDADRSSGR